MTKFTTSWDDGYASDRRVDDLLVRFNCTGTFYVCPRAQHGRKMLKTEEIRSMSERREIGAHTVSHPYLTQIDSTEAEREIAESKHWVEEITGKPCTMFCYPYGDTDAVISSMVRKAGYHGARTTDALEFNHIDPFAMPITLQIKPFPFRKNFKPLWKIFDPFGPYRVHAPRLRELGIPFSRSLNWLSLAKSLLDHAIEMNQPWFHLFGHSAEIEKYGMWGDLEKFLEYVKGKGVECVTNSELLSSKVSP